eukprot:s1187_g12.t1
MAEQQKKLHACQALAQGKKLRSLHHIQQALEIAQEAGLSHMEMKTALDAQKEIKKMDEAAERLETAMDLRDLEKLRWAIKWAKEFWGPGCLQDGFANFKLEFHDQLRESGESRNV